MCSIYSDSVRLLHPDAIGSYRTLSLLNIAHHRRTRYRVPSGEAIALAYTVVVVWSLGHKFNTWSNVCSPAHLCAVTFEEVSFPLQNQIAVCNRPTPFPVFYARLKIYNIANDVCRYTLQFDSVCVMDWSKLLYFDWKIKGHEFTCNFFGRGGGICSQIKKGSRYQLRYSNKFTRETMSFYLPIRTIQSVSLCIYECLQFTNHRK